MTTSVGRRFARAGSLLSMAMLAASAANYALNLALARLLEPAEFGDASFMVTLLLGLTAAGVAMQLVTAHHVANAAPADLGPILRHHVRRARRLGLLVSGTIVVLAPALRHLFQTQSAIPFVVLAIGIPVYLIQSAQRGLLQGRLEFARLAASYAVEAVVRLVGGLAFVWIGLGVNGATAALSLSFLGSWLVLRPALPTGADHNVGWTGSGSRTASHATAILLLGQILINNGDVVLAKQVLDPDVAGTYAAVALLGRAVFFCSWAVANAAFPFAGDRESGRVFRLGVIAVAVTCGGAVVVLAVAGERLGPLLFGPDLAGASDLFAPYALATAMFAVANFVATFDVGRGRLDSAMAVLGGGILQSVLLLRSGSSPDALVQAQTVAMAICLLVTLAVHSSAPRRAALPWRTQRPVVETLR